MNFIKNIAILIFMIFFFYSCQQGIQFNPDFRVSDVKKLPELVCSDLDYGVISVRNEFISCSSPEFTHMACMTEDKVKELTALLTRADIPRTKRIELIKSLSKIIWWDNYIPVSIQE
jgi:hypothetical protein